MENTIRCKPEVETVSQTGSTINLATETDIDAISVSIPMFLGARFFTGVYMPMSPDASFTQKLQDGGRSFWVKEASGEVGMYTIEKLASQNIGIATEIVSISVSVAKLLVLPV